MFPLTSPKHRRHYTPAKLMFKRSKAITCNQPTTGYTASWIQQIHISADQPQHRRHTPPARLMLMRSKAMQVEAAKDSSILGILG